MADPAVWRILIPVRPKAVQSVRGGRNGFYPDRKVREWKASITPFIAAGCAGKQPTAMPLKINKLTYYFRLPKKASAEVCKFIGEGGIVPYLGTADITDNLAKGLIDCCAGLVFQNDKQIWKICESQKLYGLNDGIYLEFEETPGVITDVAAKRLQVHS